MADPTSSSSSSFTNKWSYDVFLSFRGEDTRTGFTGHLYHILREKGVNTFMDNHGLRKGEEITPSLMKAIEESRVAIVIFSENYASSTFCLQELLKIMECFKQKKDRLVWPVFYKVEPSDVRHQKGSYAEALAKHEARISDKKKLEKWRVALEEAASLSGWHSNQSLEYDIIREIFQEVSKRINRNLLYVAKYPVGLDSRVHKVKSLLEDKSNHGVHMVGIYGIGGIGKTTLACAVYNSIAEQFEGLSFLSDIRQNCEKYGLIQLQEKLLSDMLVEKDFKLGNVKEGIPIIKSRLTKKKILLILDDVNNLEQLEHLAGGLDWFGSGSRIIITTRDIHLLRSHGIDRTYEVEGLNDEEALELFSWSASRRKQVDSNYLEIPKRVVGYSNGLPLSLEIIGSALIGKPESVWMSALDVYERTPHENIQERLRVSYDGLEDREKQIFLDLACFFIGYELTDVKEILHSSYAFGTDYAIEVLIDKCLVKIINNCVRMHNLIEDMGREIVRQESPSEPGERSRLWFYKDIVHVLKENKGSYKAQIIMLALPKDKEVQWDGTALEKMKNLRILVVKNARFSRGPTALPKSLRVLIWHGYPESSLPAEFDPKKLVILDLSESSFTFKNQLNMKFKSLTEMKLRGCESLKKVPDLSGTPNLKQLRLDYCINLVEVHDSVGFLTKLECLSLDDCTSLRVLPRVMKLPSLKTISLKECTSLESFPEILGKMENIQSLDLSGSGISGLPFSIGNLVGLTRLTLNRCNELLELSSSIFVLPKLTHLVADFCQQLARVQNREGQDQETMSSNFRKASFNDCALTDEFLNTLVPCMHYVRDLSIDFSNITILPSSLSICVFLKKLSLNGCWNLREIRGLPPNIKYLSAFNCTSLTSNSKEKLLNQTLHDGGTHFIFPEMVIPSWFNLKSRGPSMSFWFRNKFPAIYLCVMGVFRWSVRCKLGVFRNGLQQCPEITLLDGPVFDITETNNIIMYELQHKFEESKSAHTNIENEWYSVEISFENDETIDKGIEWMGVHVAEQRTNMEDIRFKYPDLPMSEKQWQIRLSTARSYSFLG